MQMHGYVLRVKYVMQVSVMHYRYQLQICLGHHRWLVPSISLFFPKVKNARLYYIQQHHET